MTMERINYYVAAMLIAGTAVLAACSSDDTSSVEQPAQHVYTLAINATFGEGSATTRALTESGSTLTASWNTSENVYVKKGSSWLDGTLKPDANSTTATLKGTLSGTPLTANDVLTLQFPKSGDITYAGQTGTLADIAANFDYATTSITVQAISSNNNVIPTTPTTTFRNQQAIVKFTLQNGAGTALSSPTVLKINDGTSDVVTLTSIPATTYTTNGGTGVLYVAVPAISNKDVKLTATVGGIDYSTTKTGVTFANGNYYTITAKLKATPSVTAPTAKTGLTYTGSSQELITAGSTSGGEMQYKLGSGGTYSTTIPAATDAGTYTVYWKVDGGGDYEDVAEQTFNVTIAKAAGSISFEESTITKTTEDVATFTNTLTKTGDGAVAYVSSNTSVATVDASGLVTIKGLGTTTITATVTDSNNYTYATKTATFTLTVTKNGVESERQGYGNGGSQTW